MLDYSQGEQMMEAVLNDLIRLIGYTEKDREILQDTSDVTQAWTEEITQHFYNTLYGYKSTQVVFKDGERAARENTLRHWYRQVSGGQIDQTFWQHQWFVGLVHIPRGISNPFMLGMMSRLQQLFRIKCLQTFDRAKAEIVYTAFKRVTDIIAGLIAEGYFQSYVQAMERMSGQSRNLIDRMVHMEVQDMVIEERAKH